MLRYDAWILRQDFSYPYDAGATLFAFCLGQITSVTAVGLVNVFSAPFISSLSVHSLFLSFYFFEWFEEKQKTLLKAVVIKLETLAKRKGRGDRKVGVPLRVAKCRKGWVEVGRVEDTTRGGKVGRKTWWFRLGGRRATMSAAVITCPGDAFTG